MTRRFLTTALCLCLGSSAFAQSPAEYRVPRAAEPPKLDGILDDQVWAQAPMPTGQWVSYNPNRGDKMPDVYRTDVRIAYDDRNLYFAFHCFDNEPAKIRTNIAKRDAAFSDDWIALSLDSAGTGQTAYHLFSNPSAQPDGRAQHVRVRRAVRRRHGLVQRREDDRATATSSKCRSRCRRCGSPAATK